MLLLEINKVKKYYGDRLIMDIDNLLVYSGDKIGIVGVNGAGKSTLLNIICNKSFCDEGSIKMYESYSYITQIDEPENISENEKNTLSGGEKTKLKIQNAFDKNSGILLADEPTSNLDIAGIQMLEKKLKNYKGSILIVSHDRELLDNVCNKILELDNGKVKLYNGNYSEYIKQKQLEKITLQGEYDRYIKEKKKLEICIDKTKGKSNSIRRTPKRMGNSEARLHKMGGQKGKMNLDNAAKALESRLNRLEVKQKPKDLEKTKLDIKAAEGVYSKILIEGKNINKAFNKKLILEKGFFQIYNGSKVALVGPNGCGKTTLIKMILNGEEGIVTSNALKIGYFSQTLNILDESKTILQNVIDNSIYDETFARIILGRLLFKRDDVYKKVSVLSGGEKVKVSLAKIILSDVNTLILDEPTNYLDIYSVEALEKMFSEYNGTILFVSHDRRFINKVANKTMVMENHKISIYDGNYDDFLQTLNKKKDIDKSELKMQKMILQNRLSEVLGRLSMPSKTDDIEKLDSEYKEILNMLKELKDV
ncbi:ribosomal protection-like ABC-F family protein [Clostridium lundense]|uniref:ribosomal protection-like ABC-F family protein n=1 Tax=Clostridium lundense TaxID=319475 RepID=UPI000486DBE2|nr:ABC-F type ribosomal protection protein [Clostridium lundense]